MYARKRTVVLGARLFNSSETKFSDFDDIKNSFFYSGEASGMHGAPTMLLDSVRPQAAAFTISNDWHGRGFQIAVTQYGISARFQ